HVHVRSSEGHADPKLYGTRASKLLKRHEAAVRQRARAEALGIRLVGSPELRSLECAVGRPEVGDVEKIECLDAQLHLETRVQLQAFGQDNIHLTQRRGTQRIAAERSLPRFAGNLEGCGVQVSARRAQRICNPKRRAFNGVRTNVVRTAEQ